MANYYTQNATVGTYVYKFYGAQSKHDHDKADKFTKTVKAIMKVSFPKDEARLSDFVSNASSVPTGGRQVVELKWKGSDWTQT